MEALPAYIADHYDQENISGYSLAGMEFLIFATGN
jgi:hypothetical protein